MPTAATTKAGRKIDLTQPVQLRCRWVMAIKMSDLVRSFEKASPNGYPIMWRQAQIRRPFSNAR
jgi:hypothetical protein